MPTKALLIAPSYNDNASSSNRAIWCSRIFFAEFFCPQIFLSASSMRKFQITVFVVATLALLAAAGCIGKPVGTELWNAGIAALLFDIVCLQLWPPTKGV